MARIRTVKPEFWTSAQVMECRPLTRLLFLGMLNFADDAGRMGYSPKTIKAQVFPSDEFPVAEIQRMIVELSSNGLVLIYSADGKEYIQITGWHHQRIDRPKTSSIPAPFVEESSNDRRSIATDLSLSNSKGAEVTRDEDSKKLGDFCQAIVAAYAEANSPTLPDTSRAGLWLQQGFDPEICLAVIREIVRKKPNASLAYFDKPIREAHESKAPPRASIAPPKDDGSVEVLDQYALEAWDAHRMKTEGKTYPRNKKGGWRFPSKFPPGHEAVLLADVERLVAQRSPQ